ncbi:hypothetical protein B0H14DRAFT_2625705 [Mycena olivaceomarginata]|nr:hypothetical protein B0H14DRAFT_2625705 [Mycena olivaceomarginata]
MFVQKLHVRLTCNSLSDANVYRRQAATHVDLSIPHKDPYVILCSTLNVSTEQLALDRETAEKYWYCDNPRHPTRRAKNIIPSKFRNMFDSKAIVLTEVLSVSNSAWLSLLRRSSRSSAPRVRNLCGLCRTTSLTTRKRASVETPLAWDRTRGSDFRCLAQTIRCIAVSSKTVSIRATEKWLADSTPMDSAFVACIENTYRVFGALVREPRNSAGFAKISPVEFIMIGILVHRHKKRLSLKALGNAVSAMRQDVRKHHEDIRNNNKVYKTMLSFIDGYQGTSPGHGEPSAEDTVDSQNNVGGKRKASRQPAGGNEESDDDYAPKKRAKTTPKGRPLDPPATLLAPTSASAKPLDAIRAARARLEAQRLKSGGGLFNITPLPFSFNPDAQQQELQMQGGNRRRSFLFTELDRVRTVLTQ